MSEPRSRTSWSKKAPSRALSQLPGPTPLRVHLPGSIKPNITEAILGIVGNLSIFRVGTIDAPFLARQLASVDLDSLINLPNYRMFTKLMVNGVQTKAFSARTLPSHQSLSQLPAIQHRPRQHDHHRHLRQRCRGRGAGDCRQDVVIAASPEEPMGRTKPQTVPLDWLLGINARGGLRTFAAGVWTYQASCKSGHSRGAGNI